MSKKEPAPQNPGLTVIEPSQAAAPANPATLSLETKGDTYVLKAASGTSLPADIPLVDGDGKLIVTYRAARADDASAPAESRRFTGFEFHRPQSPWGHD
ncbi:hypothetical protein [Streptomyces luteolus]|uniref:Uncharacterized protein n=1 Tax=Streptomyces luteolus TaxID=3043615 RepID=A0ABT6SZ55_9ACTN|nr:hypothetical protein [Streptomyces sp. B-S-A12]MDI3420892.1 hypothetical protein [Streptomyces sp. B-S-A12]